MENNKNKNETINIENLEVTETAKDKLSKKEIALIITAGLALGCVGFCFLPKTAKGEKVYNDIKNFFKPTTSVATKINQTKDYTAEDYANMDIKYSQEELNKMTFEELNDVYTEYGVTLQQDVFNLLESTQNYMNEESFPSIKLDSDGDKQLYLYAKEIVALYTIGNADTYTSKELVERFGNSGVLSSADIQKSFEEAIRNISIYDSRATQSLGLNNIFIDEKDKEIADKCESFIISYNNETVAAEKTKIGKELINYIESLIDSSVIDNLSKTNPGGVTVSLLRTLSFLKSNGLIDEVTATRFEEKAGILLCDILYPKVKRAEDLSYVLYDKTLTATGIYKVGTEEAMLRAMDYKDVLALGLKNRNIGWGKDDKSSITDIIKSYFSKTSSETIRKEISRDEAVNYFSEEVVKQAEDKARQEVEKGNGQAEIGANDYQLGYNSGYALAYNNAAVNGTMISTSTSGSARYQEGYSNGINNGYNDGMIEYRAKQNAINNPPKEEVIEKPVEPVIPTPVPEPVQPQPTPEPVPTPAPVVVETPVTEPVVPDTSAGEEIDPDFVGTSAEQKYVITFLDGNGIERDLSNYNGNSFVRARYL